MCRCHVFRRYGRARQMYPVSNQITLRFDKGTLLIRTLDWRPSPSVVDWPCQWDSRVAAWRCEAIYYPRAVAALRRLGRPFTDAVPVPPRVPLSDARVPPLRPEQEEAVAAWEQHGRRGQIIMPTGTGKTVVALAAISRVKAASLIVAPVRDLMYQWHRRIYHDLKYDAGIIGDNRYSLRPICVTTYDSAYIHMPEIGDRFGLLIFDEEHHLPGPCYREAALFSTAPMRLGLTATPWRSDGRHEDLAWLVGPVAYDMPFQQARQQRLADYDVVRVPVALAEQEQAEYDRCARVIRAFLMERRKDRPGLTWQDVAREAAADPLARHAFKAYLRKKAIEDRAQEKLRVLEDLFRLHAGAKTIVFAGSNAMAMEVSRRFLLPTILSHTPKRERLAVLDGFAAGEFPAIVANQVLDEGVDVPEAKVAVVIGGQASTRQAAQRLGRILRRVGDARAVLYEVVCETSGETQRSRRRRQSDAYQRTGHRTL